MPRTNKKMAPSKLEGKAAAGAVAPVVVAPELEGDNKRTPSGFFKKIKSYYISKKIFEFNTEKRNKIRS